MEVIYIRDLETDKLLQMYEDADRKLKGIPNAHAEMVLRRGILKRKFGEFDPALKDFSLCINQFDDCGNKRGIFETYIAMSDVYRMQKDYQSAEEFCLKSIEGCDIQIKNDPITENLHPMLAQAKYCLARNRILLDQLDGSLELLEKAETILADSMLIDRRKETQRTYAGNMMMCKEIFAEYYVTKAKSSEPNDRKIDLSHAFQYSNEALMICSYVNRDPIHIGQQIFQLAQIIYQKEQKHPYTEFLVHEGINYITNLGKKYEPLNNLMEFKMHLVDLYMLLFMVSFDNHIEEEMYDSPR